MKVIYPVVFFEESDHRYSVFVPDLDNISTFGDTLEDAMAMVEELIAGYILDKIDNNEKVPNSSKIEKISMEKIVKELDIDNWDYISKFKTYIMVNVSEFAQKWGKELVKKTVNIPKWINVKAESLNINFSKTLEDALLEKIAGKQI